MKKQTLFKSIFGVAVIALLLPMVSCDAAGNPSALVGRWVEVSAKDGEIMDLLSDGTGVVTKGSKGVAITWKTESGRFYVTAFGTAQSQNYKLQGSILTFTDDNGKIEEYTKCKKDCKETAKEYAKAKAEKAAAALKAKAKSGSFTDARDSKTYKTVKLENQTWMAENLNYNADGSKCYENQESNCQKYGRLYNWETAKSACPKSWHLPSDAEWQVLVDLVASVGEAGTMLKSSNGWSENGDGVDAVGFSALPGGNGYSSGVFGGVGKHGHWWSGTENNASYAYYRGMRYSYATVYRSSSDKSDLFSVRCVQD
jgi:uncharacterized protein (TIGR02145 family)